MLGLSPETTMLAAVVLPFIGAIAIAFLHRSPNLREAATLVTAVLLAALVWSLAGPVMAGARPDVALIEVVPGLPLAFKVEPLGLMFALVASTLWIVNSIYSIGYMRAHDEPRQTTFYVCFAIALGSAVGLAFSRNLFTLFLFYELLTLSTYPLVTHNGDRKALIGGRIYLMLLIGSSMVLLLPAIIVTAFLSGTTEFTAGGILPKGLDATIVGLLLALSAFGIGKAALMPLHFWLPSAMVAPTPVSALLHAVAVVKAGVFTVLKVVIYVFGVETLTAGGARDWLVYFASATLIAASLVALTRQNLKARLAYSTVSQLSYVVLAAAIATSSSLIGGGMHIVMHAAGKITLFFCAGAIYVAAHKTEIGELDGIGRRMPVTMAAFFIASLSIIGLPPFGGVWSKWLIGAGALDAGFAFVVGVLMVSSLLNVAYLLPIVGRAFFLPPKPDDHDVHGEAPLACLIPIVITATLCLVLFFAAGTIEELLRPLVTARPG
jgi:multicomponent Na+:H+ antiporter subunit D